MKLFAIVNLTGPNRATSVKKVINKLEKFKDIECFLSKDDSSTLFKNESHQIDDINTIDYIVSIGGDGTFMLAAKTAIKYNKPLFGINIGRVGYLCKYRQEEVLKAKSNIFNNLIERKAELLSIKKDGHKALALNDFFFLGKNAGHSIEFLVKTKNKEFDVKASGLIVSTYIGSTAYNKAAGGPMLDKNLSAMVITSICNSNLTLGSYIVPITDKIEIYNLREKDEIEIYSDGNLLGTLKDKIIVERSHKYLRYIE